MGTLRVILHFLLRAKQNRQQFVFFNLADTIQEVLFLKKEDKCRLVPALLSTKSSPCPGGSGSSFIALRSHRSQAKVV